MHTTRIDTPDRTSTICLVDLPTEVLMYPIGEYLSPRDICSLRLVSRATACVFPTPMHRREERYNRARAAVFGPIFPPGASGDRLSAATAAAGPPMWGHYLFPRLSDTEVHAMDVAEAEYILHRHLRDQPMTLTVQRTHEHRWDEVRALLGTETPFLQSRPGDHTSTDAHFNFPATTLFVFTVTHEDASALASFSLDISRRVRRNEAPRVSIRLIHQEDMLP